MLTEHIKLLSEQMSKTPLWMKCTVSTNFGYHIGTVAVYQKVSEGELRMIYSHTVSLKEAKIDQVQQVFDPMVHAIIMGLREQHYFKDVEGVRAEVLTNLVESLELSDRGKSLGTDVFGRIVYQGDLDFLYVTDDETGREYEVSYDGSVNER